MAEIAANKKGEELLDLVEELAEGYQYQYGGCGQAIIVALQRCLDLPGGPEAVKATGYVGLGIARMGDTCGALLGAIIALGLASGRANLKDAPYPEPEVVDKTTGNPKSLETVRGFYRKFVENFGSSTCRDIQIKMFGRSYDLGNPEGLKQFKQVSQGKCAEMVGKTARLVAQTILDMPRR